VARTNLAPASDFIDASIVADCGIGQSLASRPNDDLQRSSASGVSEGVVGQHHISQGEMMCHELLRLEFSGQNRLQEHRGRDSIDEAGRERDVM